MRIEQIRKRLRACGAKPCHEELALRAWAQALPLDSGRSKPEHFLPLQVRTALPAITAENLGMWFDFLVTTTITSVGAKVITAASDYIFGSFIQSPDSTTLLAAHAATAIFSSKLYSQSERKLNTIQSFLDLLTTSS